LTAFNNGDVFDDKKSIVHGVAVHRYDATEKAGMGPSVGFAVSVVARLAGKIPSTSVCASVSGSSGGLRRATP